MPKHQLSSSGYIAGDDDIQQLAMRSRRFVAFMLVSMILQANETVPVGLVPESLQGGDEELVVRGGVDRPVKSPVSHQFGDSRSIGQRSQLGQGRTHLRDVAGPSALGSKRGGQRIECTTYLKKVPRIFRGEFGDLGITVRVQLDEPFGFEMAQRLPEWSGADAKFTRKRGLIQNASRLVLVQEDSATNQTVGEGAFGRKTLGQIGQCEPP